MVAFLSDCRLQPDAGPVRAWAPRLLLSSAAVSTSVKRVNGVSLASRSQMSHGALEGFTVSLVSLVSLVVKRCSRYIRSVTVSCLVNELTIRPA